MFICLNIHKIQAMKIFISRLPLFVFILSGFSLMAHNKNIAPEARISASSSLNSEKSADKVADGIIGVEDLGEWACEGMVTSWGYIELPWVQMDWDQPQKVNRITLYDRTTEAEHAAAVKLTFSDGSEIYVRQLPDNGNGKEVLFDTKTIEWLKIEVVDADGKDIGFSEIEVFSAPEQTNDPITWVDPYIESSRGRYIFFITGSRPFGMATEIGRAHV